ADLLARLVPDCHAIEWLPVPSNLPTVANLSQVAKIRQQIAPEPGRLVGHFGTFGTSIAKLLTATLPRVLFANHHHRVLLVGLNSQRFRDQILKQYGELKQRIFATGSLSHEDAANCLAASDMLFQPYVDGISSRRGSVM